jgi:hypothetical protein
MRPIYPYIAVERTESKSSLVQAVDHRPVVKVLEVCSCPEDEVMYYSVGNKILVNHVDEYMVDGEKLFFVHIKDVVCVV